MTGLDALPLWAAVLAGVAVVVGAATTLLGSIGLLRLTTFYERAHAPTLGSSMGAAFVLLGSIVLFSALGTRAVVHEVLLWVFVTVTTPVTLVWLVRTATGRKPPD